ncbi:MAG: phage holin family protein [Giesbergeria sp.]
MDWLALLGLGAFVDRWRANAIEAAIAAEDRATLFRLELRDYKRQLALMLSMGIAIAALTVVTLMVLSCAIMVHFWDTPERITAAWTVTAVWLVLWIATGLGLWSMVRKASSGFSLTRQELARDWQDLKEKL